MTTMGKRFSPRRRRAGFTLIELMIVVSMLGIIGSMLTLILVRQQRFHRAVASVADARARMRDVATILPTDLRSASTAGGDILAISDTSMQFRAFVGTSIVCAYDATDGTIVELPPTVLSSGNVLSSWINPPAPNDIAYVYNDGTFGGNADDTWQPITITDTTSDANATWCSSTASTPFTEAADNGARRYRITLASAPSAAQVKLGAPIRFAREVRYSIYTASDGQSYIGYQRCTPNATYGQLGTCGTRELLAGPVKPGTADTLTSGLYFVYRNKSGARITSVSAADTIATIGIGVRTTSESLLKATAKVGGSTASGDSIRFVVGMRNRV